MNLGNCVYAVPFFVLIFGNFCTYVKGGSVVLGNLLSLFRELGLEIGNLSRIELLRFFFLGKFNMLEFTMLEVFVCEPFLFVYPHRYLYLCTVRRIGHTHIKSKN